VQDKELLPAMKKELERLKRRYAAAR